MQNRSFLAAISRPGKVITAIDTGVKFPEIVDLMLAKYKDDVDHFIRLVTEATSSADLLAKIRSRDFEAGRRMSLLKIFRRSVSTVLDTEATKKIKSIPTQDLVADYGFTFKPIETLKAQFSALTPEGKGILAVLIGEYDSRGQLGYVLTGMFFDWFETRFKGKLTIEGPRGAGRDIELKRLFPGYQGDYPCDFVIREGASEEVLAIGFARYDATRGGAQSDDRTGGNSDKVAKAKQYCSASGDQVRLLFLAEGPGLAHRDTWKAACELDGDWDGNVRVTTLKLAPKRVTAEWLRGEE